MRYLTITDSIVLKKQQLFPVLSALNLEKSRTKRSKEIEAGDSKTQEAGDTKRVPIEIC